MRAQLFKKFNGPPYAAYSAIPRVLLSMRVSKYAKAASEAIPGTSQSGDLPRRSQAQNEKQPAISASDGAHRRSPFSSAWFDSSDELRKELVGSVARILWRGDPHVNRIGLLPNLKLQERAAVLLPGHHGVHTLDGVWRIPEHQFEAVPLVG